MENHIEDLSNIYPRCPHLVTLFLNNNKLEVISSRFFHYMPSLKVLKLSHIQLTELPSRISKLVSLQHLDLSHTRIKELPGELEILVNLKCLNLNHTMYLSVIPRQLISKFSMLHVLRMFSSLYFKNSEVSGDGVLFARDELLVEELLGLKNLEVLEFTLTSSRVLQIFLTSNELRRCSQALFLDGLKNSKWIDASQLAELKHLNRLRIRDCEELEELTVDLRQSCVFNSLQKVQISLCSKLKDLTFLVFAPNVKSIEIRSCLAMEEIISVQKFADFPETVRNNLNPFAKLQHLELVCLRNLNSIYWKPLPFSQLKEMLVDDCYFLKKLPLDFNSAKERKIVIRGEEYWWRRLQWEDEATQNAFSPCFKSLWQYWMEILEQRLHLISGECLFLDSCFLHVVLWIQTTLPVFSLLDNLVLLHQRYSTCLERNVLLGCLCSTHTFSLKKNIYFIFYAFSEPWNHKHIWGKCIEKYIWLYFNRWREQIRFWSAIPHRTIIVQAGCWRGDRRSLVLLKVSDNWFPSSILIMMECLFFLKTFFENF